MDKVKNISLLSLLFIFFLQAEPKAVVFDFQPIGVDEYVVKTTTQLLKDRLSDLKVFTIIEPPPNTRGYTVAEACEVSRELNVEKAIIGNIMAIGKKLIISYKLVDISSGEVEFSDRATITSIEDLDVASERIAWAIKDKKPYGKTAEVGMITEIEEKPFRIRAPHSSILFSTGYAFPLQHHFPYDPGGKLFSIDASVSYETPDIFALGTMGLRRGKYRYSEIYFDILVHKIFSKLDISPFLGGGAGIRKIEFAPEYPLSKKADDGPAVTVSGGLILFRTYYFRVITGLKGSLIFTEEFGTVSSATFNFGLTSPLFGPEGVQAPTPCILGCLGAFFLTGVIIALAS